MVDTFDTNKKGLSSPGDIHFPIVTSPDKMDPRPRSVYCAIAGNLAIEDSVGTSIVYTMTAGEVLTFRGTKITAIGGGGAFVGWL